MTYNKVMVRLLPITALIAFFSLFGLLWIVFDVDPEIASWYFFALFAFLTFVFTFCFLGTLLYFARTRLYKKYDPSWYFKTSFQMAFFVAIFVAMAILLSLLDLLTTLNLFLTIAAVLLFAVWSYLGKRK